MNDRTAAPILLLPDNACPVCGKRCRIQVFSESVTPPRAKCPGCSFQIHGATVSEVQHNWKRYFERNEGTHNANG